MRFLVCFASVIFWFSPALADPPEVQCSSERLGAPVCIAMFDFAADACRVIETSAKRHGLDPHFFVRLIWQESRFDPNAISPANALGIAQFIPSTAKLRGLRDPFNPADALAHSAQYLAEMAARYGNPGLAAVGYNGGERRAEGLIAGTGGLARETVEYVRIVTGVDHAAWLNDPAPTPDFRLSKTKPFHAACLDLAINRKLSPPRDPKPVLKPWGIQMAFGTSRKAAQKKFISQTRSCSALLKRERPDFVFRKSRASRSGGYYMVRLGRDSRDQAWRDCTALKRRGCICAVYPNSG